MKATDRSGASRQAIQQAGNDLLSRIDETIKGLTSLHRPYVDPCLSILTTLQLMPEAIVLKAGRGDVLRDLSDKLIAGQLDSAEAFVASLRRAITSARDAARDDRLRQIVRCEIVFEEQVINLGLQPAPELSPQTLVALQQIVSKNKVNIGELVILYGVEKVGKQISFNPNTLPAAAKRRLLELVAAGVAQRGGGDVRPAPVKPTTLAAIDDGADLFAEVMGAAHTKDTPNTAGGLTHNDHRLENFIPDVSPVHSTDDDDEV